MNSGITVETFDIASNTVRKFQKFLGI